MKKDKSPLLTDTQWQVLNDPEGAMDAGMSDADRRSHRARARDRVRDIIRDFAYLFPNMTADDRRQLFSNLRAYREHRSDKRAAEREALETTEDDSNTHRMRAVEEPEPSLKAERGEELYEGIVALLAFLYAGVDDREEFADMVEKAIRVERNAENLLPLTTAVSITVDRERERDEIIQQLDEDEIDRDELRVLLREYPMLIFDAVLGEDENTDEDEE